MSKTINNIDKSLLAQRIFHFAEIGKPYITTVEVWEALKSIRWKSKRFKFTQGNNKEGVIWRIR